MYKIHCLNPISENGLSLLTDQYERCDQLEQADAVLVRSAAMHDLEVPETLEAVARAGAGVNNIPIESYAKKGIVVFNTPGANANGVKELTIAGMLLASRDICGGIDWVKDNKGDKDISKTVEKAKKAFAGYEIKGKKLGVIGLGAIGVEVANAATALGMYVYGYDPYISVEGAWHLSYFVKHMEKLEDLCRECDFISIHVPLTDRTKFMLNQDTFSIMKDGVVILNMARDLLVNDEDMKAALESGKVKRYVTDFPNAMTANMPGVIAIPHLGASTEEAEENCAVMAVRQLMDYMGNGNIKNSVNYPACNLGSLTGACRLAIFNENIPNMIGQLSAVLAAEGINITSMANQSKGQLAYTLIDTDQDVSKESVDRLKAIQGVFKVRVIR